ncbi:MAG: haloalkane dehalogenase [Pseudomonadota bacterium]|nr:haloalkane dehalogenase [Pseudomonadota bacterium]
MIRPIILAACLVAATALTGWAEPKLPVPEISEDQPFPVQETRVLDSTMTWIETGEGTPVLFLHGNPTSSYLWRNVLPEVGKTHRAIAVDLIGMGGSGKPDIAYTFADHARYLSAFIDKMELTEFALVGHDWGAALAWDFASRHPERVTALSFMEGVLPPSFPLPGYEVMGETGEALRALRTPNVGEELVITQNMFVEQMLPGFVNRPLGEKAMAAYRAPFERPADRFPTLQWPRELPIGGSPETSVDLMGRITRSMAAPAFPVQLLYVEPGVIAPAEAVEWYRVTIPGLETHYVGQGLHFFQEDHPKAIGLAISDWLRRQS